jgi:site-specific DNA-methyltransferase (adenine-specific)
MSKYQLIFGDCMEKLGALPDLSVDAVCTDPPYGVVEFTASELAKLRNGRGGIWRLPPKLNGCQRSPLPRFTVLTGEQRDAVSEFFAQWGKTVFTKLKPGAHVLLAGNPLLQMYVQRGMVSGGFENRATILRLYHGFRGGDRPKNAEAEFAGVCVTPRGNYEPWMLFRKPLAEKTVAQNLRKWGTGGLRMMRDNKPLPDVIPSFKTPQKEKLIAGHPSLKPQHLLRIFTRALLPTGSGLVLDPFMGSGSTIAAALTVGAEAIGIEKDEHFFQMAEHAVPALMKLYPQCQGDSLPCAGLNGSTAEYTGQLTLLGSVAI